MQKKFTFLEFETAARLDLLTNKSWRAGQGLFNTLHRINPELANEIRATELDPFYMDDRIPAFWKWLGERMGW